MDEYRYCPRCGHPLERRLMGDRERLVCPQCGFIFYVNPTPAAGTLVEDDGHVLLIRRAVPPRRGYWAFPAGYMEADESAEEAAIRETKEETGLDVALDALLNVYSFEDSMHQRGVLILYRAHVVGGTLQPGDDAEDARWFAPHELPPREAIAFSTHWDALQRWLQARAVLYRPAVAADLPAIAELIHTYQQPRWDLNRYLHDPLHHLLVADDRGYIVGYCGLRIEADEAQAVIDHVFVHPHHRRWGIGSHLIEHAMDVARREGVALVTTEVDAGNPGIVVYLKKGFEVCGMTMRPRGGQGRHTTLTLCYDFSGESQHGEGE